MWCLISINFWRMIIYFFTTSTCLIILQANPSSQIYNPWDYRRENVPNVEISWGQCLESRHRRKLFDCGGSNFSPERGAARGTRWKLWNHMTLSLATIQTILFDLGGGSKFSPERGLYRGKLLSHPSNNTEENCLIRKIKIISWNRNG